MIISTSTGMCSTVLHTQTGYYSCEESIRAIAEAGYQGVDMGFAAYERNNGPMTQPDWKSWLEKQRDLALSLGLVINQGHAHFYSSVEIPKFTPLEYEEHQQIIARDIEAAGMCGIPWLVIHPDSWVENGWYSRRITVQREVERFKRFGDIAAKHHVGIAIENMIDVRPITRYAGSHEDLLELLDRLGDDELFGVCWDTGHANLNQVDQPTAILALGKRLRALHVNDNYGAKDDHTLPFLGTISWVPLMHALKESGYAGAFTYEIHKFTKGFDPKMHHESMRFARQTAECLLML